MNNEGMLVSVHYTGTLDDGTKFDSSYDRQEPLEFVCMTGMMIPGFDKAVVDMEVGQTVNVHIPCAEAYGEYNDDLLVPVPADRIPDAESLTAGETLYFNSPYGPMPIKVHSVNNGTVILDQNHELAGKDLNFEITLLSVSEAPEDDCTHDCCTCGGCH